MCRLNGMVPFCVGLGKNLSEELSATKQSLFETKEDLQKATFANKEHMQTIEGLRARQEELQV